MGKIRYAQSMAQISLTNVTQRVGSTDRLCDITLDIADREFLVVVGPSGCGKTSLLRLIAGLDPVTHGTVSIDGEPANAIPAERRGLAMVFQSHALYPHMTVADNLGFALRMAGVGRPRVAAAVRRAAALLELEPLLARKPDALSAGQRQRVAIGRAIVAAPRGYLFDEALANLDAVLRAQLRTDLVRLNRALQTTMIYVTHDQTEAMIMADRIVVLNAGRVEQIGTPRDVHDRPVNRFVAGFIGAPGMNFCPAITTEAGFLLAHGACFAALTPRAVGQHVTLGVRPEHVRIDPHGPLRGRVERIEHVGFEAHVHVQTDDAALIMRAPPDCALRAGETVPLAFDVARLHVFGPDGGAL
jgi:ABC-type sugar transport system ATPase subunit